MARIVVPFRGLAGKQRLTGLGPEGHRAVVLAMLADVLAAATAVGLTVVVTNDLEGRRLAKEAGALLVDDPGGGQSPAVAAAIPNLADDVDRREDLDRVRLRAGPHTQSALQELRIAS